MGYGWESRHGLVTVDPLLLAPVALQAAGDKGIVTVLSPITVLRLAVLATTTFTGVAAVVALDKQPYAVTGSRVETAKLTVPIGVAIGKSVYKEVVVDAEPGDQLIIELLTPATAGGGVFSLEYIPRAGAPANMIKSV